MAELVTNKSSLSAPHMEQFSITFNSARVKRVTANGREWLVAPIVSIVPGVLPGSKGALAYPPSEIIPSVPLWNDRPICNGHPYDPITNAALSADDPGVWERQGLGFLRNSSWDGRLKHEGWFDAERTQRLAPEVYNALMTGKVVECSTGLYTTNEEVPPGTTYNGRAYDFVARNYQPDHMAILTRDTGACSVRDGCGLLVNSATDDRKGGCSGDS